MEKFTNVLYDLLYLVLTGLLPLLLIYMINFLKIKIKEQTDKLDNESVSKYINTAIDVIGQVVIEVNQTFVDGLKKNGSFTEDSARQAKELAVEKCKQLISEKSKQAIEMVYNDFDVYLNSKIEELVKINKGN